MKKILYLALFLISALFLASCKTDPTVTGFTIDATNVKKVYNYGEDLSMDGLVVKIQYSDDSEEIITTDYTVDSSLFNNQVAGTYDIKVSYLDFEVVTYQVTVNEARVTDLVIDTSNVKKVYKVGEALTLEGLIVKEHYENNTDVTISDYEVDDQDYDKDVAGEYEIEITKGEFTKTFTVSVVAPEVTGIKITTDHVKKAYFIGEELSLTGLVVHLVYDNGTETVLESGYDVNQTAFDNTAEGNYDLVVSYGDFEAKTFTVSVKVALPTGIKIETNPTKTEYLLGETFALDGLIVKLVYEDGTEAATNDYEVDMTSFNNLEDGTYSIIVKYQTLEQKTFNVTVLNKMNISTPVELELMIQLGGDTEYVLTSDIDMSNVTTLVGGKKSFSGIFDGKGYTISGLDVTADGNKMGIFFKEVLDGAVIKNLNFKDSIYHGGGTGEASAFITAYAYGGATFSNITFTDVTVAHSGSYAALVFGDTLVTSEKPITISHISVYNDELNEVRGKSYIGGLVGRLNHELTLDMSYVYFNSQVRAGIMSGDTFTADQAAGLLIGRLTAAETVINLNNVVINGNVTASKNVGAVIGTSVANTTLNTNHVLINQMVATSGSTKVDILVGNPNGMTITNENTFYVSESTELYETLSLTPHTPTQGTSIANVDLTTTWFTNSGFDQDYFVLFGQFVRVKNEFNTRFISTPEDLINMILTGGSYEYILANDIDMSEVTTLTGGSKSFSGTFDGYGYTISGLDVTADGNKMGIFFKEVLDGAVIKNLNFKESIYHGGGTGEASAFITAYAYGGATFSNITFTNVTVAHGGSYAALVFGDTKEGSDKPIELNRITVNNDEDNEIRGKSYIGGLVGRLNHSLTLDMSNIYFNSIVRAGILSDDTFTPDQAAGLLIGRLTQADTVINLDNVVVNGTATASKNVGGILGTSVANTTLNTNYVLINQFIGKSGSNKVDILVGNPNSMTINDTNTFYVTENTELYETADLTPHTPNQATSIALSDLTETWFTNSGFDQDYFVFDNGRIIVNGQNTGVKEETGFIVIATDVDKLYVVGEDLFLSGLVVKAKFSDGTREELTQDDYQITHEFNTQTPGTYTITISYKDYEDETFDVKVVSVIGFKVYDEDMRKTYLLGEDLSLNNLVIRAILSDDSEVTLNSSDYSINDTQFDSTTAGEYDLSISYKDFTEQIITVTVINEALTYEGNVATIKVDQSFTGIDGTVINDMNTFKTMKAALDFLTLQDQVSDIDAVEKIIYIANGKYVEKLTITIPNLTLVGESANETILSYYVKSGDIKLDGTTWGTQGSASVSVKSSAVNFQAKDLTIENSYDYFGGVANNITSDVQAVALVTEADQVIFTNVRFIGSQDTLYAKTGRQYYYDTYIEGVVDFIFGNAGPAYFEESTIYSQNRSTGVITAQKGAESSGKVKYGYVFYNNEFIAEVGTPDGSVHLGRPWGKDASVAYINNVMGSHIDPVGWTYMSGNLPENANFFEFGSKDKDGNPIVRDEAIYKGTILTQELANEYADKANVFGTTNGELTFTEWDYDADFLALSSLTYQE